MKVQRCATFWTIVFFTDIREQPRKSSHCPRFNISISETISEINSGLVMCRLVNRGLERRGNIMSGNVQLGEAW